MIELINELFGIQAIEELYVYNKIQEIKIRQIFLKKFLIYLKYHHYIRIPDKTLTKANIYNYIAYTNIQEIGKLYQKLKKEIVCKANKKK